VRCSALEIAIRCPAGSSVPNKLHGVVGQRILGENDQLLQYHASHDTRHDDEMVVAALERSTSVVLCKGPPSGGPFLLL